MTFDEQVDPRAELERLIVDNTCEWCGETKLPQLTDSGKSIVYIQRSWLCREQKQGGYTSKHWRYWRVCDECACLRHLRFDKWIFPVVANMPPMAGLMEQLVAVQPMALPAGEMMYMDFVYGDAERAPLPERHPLLRRYAEVGINYENYGRVVIDPAADKADATALLVHVLKNREPVRGRKKLGFMLDDANFREAAQE